MIFIQTRNTSSNLDIPMRQLFFVRIFKYPFISENCVGRHPKKFMISSYAIIADMMQNMQRLFAFQSMREEVTMLYI